MVHTMLLRFVQLYMYSQVQRKFLPPEPPKSIPIFRNEFNLDYRRLSDCYIKASIAQELVKLVFVCQRESFPTPLA